MYLGDILGRENLSEDAESIRRSYVSLLRCSKLESRESVRKRVNGIEEAHCVKHETFTTASKLGQVEEKRLISIRQVSYERVKKTNIYYGIKCGLSFWRLRQLEFSFETGQAKMGDRTSNVCSAG